MGEERAMFSIISRNNIPLAGTQEYECENARNEGGKGKLSKSHAYKSVELLCALLLSPGTGMAEQIRESKQPKQ